MVLAEDDDTYRPQLPPKGLKGGAIPGWQSRLQPEKVLFCG